jgi:hypothetical protein
MFDASRADGGVAIVSRDSTVSIDGVGNDTPFNDSKSSTTSGTFNDSVTGQEGDAPDGAFATATASQNTTVNFGPGVVAPYTGTGRVDASAFAQLGENRQVTNLATADSILKLVFQVTDANEPFSISGTFDALSLFPAAVVLLVDQAASPATPAVYQIRNDGNVLTDTAFDSGALSLAPATYELTISAGAGSSSTGPGGIEPFGEEHALNFDFTLGAGSEPPPPTGIPLPAGVWAGAAGLAFAFRAVRGRRTV